MGAKHPLLDDLRLEDDPENELWCGQHCCYEPAQHASEQAFDPDGVCWLVPKVEGVVEAVGGESGGVPSDD